MEITWDKVKTAAYALLEKRGLNGIYEKRLKYELNEIEKQGANGVWTNIIAEKQCFAENPNNLLLPYLFNRVQEDPIKKLQNAGEEIITSTKYQHIVDYIKKHDKIPPGIIRDSDSPDIDIDCLPEARDEIKAYAVRKYSADFDDGYGAVCNVSTWTTYLFRSAIQDIAKVTSDLGEGWCTKSEAVTLTKDLPDDADELKDGGKALCKGRLIIDGEEVDCKTTHDKLVCPKCGGCDTESPTIAKLLADIPELSEFYSRYPKVIDLAVQLVGRIRAMGKHAGALIITDRTLFGNIPLYRRAGSGKEELKPEDTQWLSLWTEGRSTQLSKFGYTKWDILGLKNMQYIYACCKLIKRNHGIDFGDRLEGWESVDPDVDNEYLRSVSIATCTTPGRAGHYVTADGTVVEISLNDEKALAIASSQNTDTIFQFDTNLAKQILGNQVRHFNDLMIINAMGHPGPMQSIPDYIERRDDSEETWRKLEDERITALLSDTCNTLVFQEQLQALWQNLAGFTSPEAQEARKAVAKKWKEKLRPIEKKWIDGASKTLGKETAIAWWDKMVTFGRYAFNKCLDKDTQLMDRTTGVVKSVGEWYEQGKPASLSSVSHSGDIITDQCVGIHDTGAQEVFEVEFDNGQIEKVTAAHRFLCTDGHYHTVSDIYEQGLDVVDAGSSRPTATTKV